MVRNPHPGYPQHVLQRALEVLLVFLRLGATSFGGPIAHLGYFRAEFVERRRWLSDREYGDLVALCQFLPGPASSQVGFAIGWRRAGALGAVAAFLAFTLPSAVVLVALALGAGLLASPIAAAVFMGLKVVAVAIVAQAVWGMARSLVPDAQRVAIAVLAALAALLLAGSGGQLLAILGGAVLGMLLCRRDDGAPGAVPGFGVLPSIGVAALAACLAILVALPVAVALGAGGWVAVLDAFTRAGAFVFGGGHVVLPLLHGEVVGRGWVDESTFLAGYGAAQAMPGPLFTFAGYLGAALGVEPNGLPGAALALLGIFLPGFLLLLGVLPFWDRLRAWTGVRALMRGANAAVVGILAAALYDPVFTSGVTGVPQFALGLVCFALLVPLRMPPWAVVLIGGAGGVLIASTSGAL